MIVREFASLTHFSSILESLRLNLIIILDIRMHGGNGIRILKAIREKNINSKVIMLTSYPYQKYRKKCMEAGADCFFDKSREFGKVMEVLGEWIAESPGMSK